jgi:hypothetical protein
MHDLFEHGCKMQSGNADAQMHDFLPFGLILKAVHMI